MRHYVGRVCSLCFFLSLCGVSCLSLNGIAAAASINLSRDVVINQPKNVVWDRMGHFNAMERWHPAVSSTQMAGADVPTRLLILKDGRIVREELIDYRENNAYTYKILDGPFPVKNYISTLSVEDEGTRTRVIWTARFEPADGVSKEKAEKTMVGVYESGLKNLMRMLR
ncbi:MAG: SRPBCC family protein [Alphaproteobacteria bacterium GM7ARS4]|nr:SRPBCC family protein [Alphaproteobacteria bacterium GM7ARS4]